MKRTRSSIESMLAALFVAVVVSIVPSSVLAQSKPNIVFIMGDDIGMWNIGAYHRGLMAGRTPHIDTLARDGQVWKRAPSGTAGLRNKCFCSLLA